MVLLVVSLCLNCVALGVNIAFLSLAMDDNKKFSRWKKEIDDDDI